MHPGAPGFRNYEEVQLCPGCGTPESLLAAGTDIRRCPACSLHFRSPRPAASELLRFYHEGGNYAGWKSEEAVRRALWRKRLRLLERHVPRGRLLDVGSGDGHFPALCRESCWTAEAVECSRAGQALCLKRGVPVLTDDLSHVPHGAGPFDAVTLWHVLEHLPDPVPVLQACRRLLRPGGILAVAVPNEGPSISRSSPSVNPFGPLHWGFETHILYFEPASLELMLRAAGFAVHAWAVDDVETRPSFRTRLRHSFHRSALALTGRQLGQALTAVARPQPDS